MEPLGSDYIQSTRTAFHVDLTLELPLPFTALQEAGSSVQKYGNIL